MDGVRDVFALDGIGNQPGEALHIGFAHAVTRHFLHPDAQPGRIARIGIVRQQIVVDDDIVRLQALRYGYPTAMGGDIDGDLMTLV